MKKYLILTMMVILTFHSSLTCYAGTVGDSNNVNTNLNNNISGDSNSINNYYDSTVNTGSVGTGSGASTTNSNSATIGNTTITPTINSSNSQNNSGNSTVTTSNANNQSNTNNQSNFGNSSNTNNISGGNSNSSANNTSSGNATNNNTTSATSGSSSATNGNQYQSVGVDARSFTLNMPQYVQSGNVSVGENGGSYSTPTIGIQGMLNKNPYDGSTMGSVVAGISIPLGSDPAKKACDLAIEKAKNSNMSQRVQIVINLRQNGLQIMDTPETHDLYILYKNIIPTK